MGRCEIVVLTTKNELKEDIKAVLTLILMPFHPYAERAVDGIKTGKVKIAMLSLIKKKHKGIKIQMHVEPNFYDEIIEMEKLGYAVVRSNGFSIVLEFIAGTVVEGSKIRKAIERAVEELNDTGFKALRVSIEKINVHGNVFLHTRI